MSRLPVRNPWLAIEVRDEVDSTNAVLVADPNFVAHPCRRAPERGPWATCALVGHLQDKPSPSLRSSLPTVCRWAGSRWSPASRWPRRSPQPQGWGAALKWPSRRTPARTGTEGAGVLCEWTPVGVVVGVGINVTQARRDLPAQGQRRRCTPPGASVGKCCSRHTSGGLALPSSPRCTHICGRARPIPSALRDDRGPGAGRGTSGRTARDRDRGRRRGQTGGEQRQRTAHRLAPVMSSMCGGVMEQDLPWRHPLAGRGRHRARPARPAGIHAAQRDLAGCRGHAGQRATLRHALGFQIVEDEEASVHRGPTARPCKQWPG